LNKEEEEEEEEMYADEHVCQVVNILSLNTNCRTLKKITVFERKKNLLDF